MFDMDPFGGKKVPCTKYQVPSTKYHKLGWGSPLGDLWQDFLDLLGVGSVDLSADGVWWMQPTKLGAGYLVQGTFCHQMGPYQTLRAEKLVDPTSGEIPHLL